MTWRQAGARTATIWACIAIAGLTAVLGGCASSSGNWRQSAAAAARSDIVTSSDESELRKRARIRLELAGTYYAQGQYTTALDEIKQALTIDPSMVAGVELRALIYDAMDDQARAEDAYKQAQSLEPNNASVLHNYGWFECRRKAYDKADALFELAVNAPMSITITKSLLARGVCQINAGRWAEAEKSLTKSYELDPANPATAYNLSVVLYRKGEFERARFYIRRVNAAGSQLTAESLWLAVRIENKLGNQAGRDEFGTQLRTRFAGSREANLFELGRYDD
jgi:type IV pilus assembly protein PilF